MKLSFKKPQLKINKFQTYLKFSNPVKNFSVHTVRALIKKELYSYFSTPVAYVILILFVIVIAVLLFGVGRFLEYGSNDLTQLFTYVSFAFVIIIPALTMGSISKEKQAGTIEYILTQPVSEFELLISKFIAYEILLVTMLASTLPFALTLGVISPLDPGQAIMQYTGGFILGTCLVSLGIATSSLFKNEITSFLTSLILSALLIILGSDLVNLPVSVSYIADRVGLLSHYQSISRGVLDIRDVLYFAAFIIAVLCIAYYLLIQEKFPKNHISLRSARITLVLTVVITLTIGYVGQFIPGRIDFTSAKTYTLSETSLKLVNNLQNDLKIELYASSNLPSEFQSDIRNVQDLIRDYVSYSSGKVSYDLKQPDLDTAAMETAQTAGIEPIRFQVSNTDSSQVTVGYFGVSIVEQDQRESINLSDQSTINNLEYQITKKIRKLTNESPKKIGFVSNNVEGDRASSFQTFNTELSELFEVTDITLENDVPTDISVVVLASPIQPFAEGVVQKIKDFYNGGGAVFFLTNTIVSNGESDIPVTNAASLRDLFSDYGVTIEESIVYDLQDSNLLAGFFPVKYPLWILPSPADSEISILKDINKTSMIWVSPLSIDESKRSDNNKIYPLLKTSESSNLQYKENLNFAIDQQWQQKNDDSSKYIAAALENQNQGRAVVVGDSRFLTENFDGIVSFENNLEFGIASIEWLAKEDSIASIKAKSRISSRLSLSSNQSTILTVAGVAVPIGLIFGFAALKYYQRYQKLRRKYSDSSDN